MKSTHKLTFSDGKNLSLFVARLTMFLQTYPIWIRDCDFFARKNVLYVDTNRYTCVDNYISGKAQEFGYQIKELK